MCYIPWCGESRCGPECGGRDESVFGDLSISLSHVLVDFKRLYSTGTRDRGQARVCYVFVQWRIGRILQRVGRTQQDVFVHYCLTMEMILTENAKMQDAPTAW